MPPPPTQVILIQADDLGVDDLGFSGNPLAHTPNLDRLARSSLLALDFTVAPVCAASRATLLTGRHFLRTGVSHVHGGKDFLHRDERTLAQALQAAAWQTGMWGKWHLGRGDGYEPWQRGFDEAYVAQLYQHEQAQGRLNGRPVRHDGRWSDDVMFDYAIDFITRHQDRRRFLYLPSMTPHAPLCAPEHWVRFHRERGTPENLARLNAMVSHLDAAVGRLVDVLHQRGELQNTLLLFCSDNGPAINRGLLTDEERRLRKISARRGWKGDIWENGVRSPLLIHWPDRFRGGVVQEPLDQVDLLPTLLDWCEVAWPDDYPKIDGSSRRRMLESCDQDSRSTPAAPIFNYANPGWITSKRAYDPAGIQDEYRPVPPEEKAALDPLSQPISVRLGRHKLLLNPYPPEDNKAPDWVLIDLLEDPGETTNLIDSLPEVAASLRQRLLEWFARIKAEPHAFTAPVFRLHPERDTEIPACAPCRVEGPLQNTVSKLLGWENDAADLVAAYQVEAPATATEYRVELVWAAPPPEGMRIELQAGAHTLRVVADGSAQTWFPPIPLSASTSQLSFRKVAEPASPCEPITLSRVRLAPSAGK